MKLITAVEEYVKNENDIFLFLAGGITNCTNWQDEVINGLSDIDNRLIVFNPRRKNFPIHDPNASLEQIEWEFNFLEQCDIFSMFFDGTKESDQPICFYELGRNIERMKNKYPNDWNKRIIISVNTNFKRATDVIIQTNLATQNIIKLNINNNNKDLIKEHINIIKQSFKYL